MSNFFHLHIVEHLNKKHHIFDVDQPDTSSRQQYLQSLTGFSMVEALVVLSILAITAVAVAPNVFVWRANMRLQSTINELLGDLQSAKALAAKHNTTVTIQFEPTDSRYQITYINSDGHMVALKPETLPSEVRIDSSHPDYTLDSHRMTFTSRGGATSGTLVVSHLVGKSKKIVVSSIGKIRTGN